MSEINEKESSLPKKEVSTNPGMQFGLPSTYPSSAIQTGLPKAAIFWDFENCPPPSGMPGFVVVENIRNCIHNFGHVTLFKAYLEIGEDSKKTLRSELQSSGVSLTDCPHNGRKDAADKMLMVDMLAFAIDNPPPATIVLISGDRDFVYALGLLRNRKYNIVLVVPGKGAPIILRSQANTILEWRYDVLNQDVWNLQQQQMFQMTNPGVSSGSSNNSSISPNSTGATAPLLSTSRSPTPSTASPNEQQKKKLRVTTGVSGEADETDQPINVNQGAAMEYEGYCFSPRAPGYFDLLVEVLEKFRLAGEPRPRRSKVGGELTLRNPLLYHRAACSSFKEYVEMAVKEGIVEVGGDKGLAWISLKESYRDKLF